MEICTARGMPYDIAMDDDSRIYGDAWFEFLGSSRTMLGSESGSNVFDFDGKLEEQINAFARANGRPPTYHEFKHVLDPLEAPFNVGQISPRVFESAAMVTPMILFRGSYSNAIDPDVHYIPLEKDFSNADAVLARLDDLEYLQGFADRAYQRLVKSGDYGYRSLARMIEATIEEEYPKRGASNLAQAAISDSTAATTQTRIQEQVCGTPPRLCRTTHRTAAPFRRTVRCRIGAAISDGAPRLAPASGAVSSSRDAGAAPGDRADQQALSLIDFRLTDPSVTADVWNCRYRSFGWRARPAA